MSREGKIKKKHHILVSDVLLKSMKPLFNYATMVILVRNSQKKNILKNVFKTAY